MNTSETEVLKPLTQAANPSVNIGVDGKGFAVNLSNANKEGKGEPIKDRDLKEKPTAFAFRHRSWRTPELANSVPPAASVEVTEIADPSLIPSKSGGYDHADSLHRVVKPEMVGDGEKGSALAKKLQDKRFPRDRADPAKVPNDNIRIWGDFLRAFGSMQGLEGQGLKGKIEAGLIIFLDRVFGKISQKTGLCHLIQNITNVIGEVTGVEGNGRGFITPVDVTNFGDTERIDLILNGYFTLVERINFDKKDSIIPRDGSFWKLFLTAETAYLNPDTGFYNLEVRKLYAIAWSELERVWMIVRQLKLVSNLDGVTTASFNLDEAVEKQVQEKFLLKYRAIYEMAQNNGIKNPVAGPFDVIRHPNGTVSHVVARYPEVDGRTAEEKRFRLPSEPIVKNTSAENFWRKQMERHRHSNLKLEKKNHRRRLQGKKEISPWRIPEIPKWVKEEDVCTGEVVEKLYMTPIVNFPEQPDRLILENRLQSESEEEFHARLYRTEGIVRRTYFWDNGFLFSFPEFKGMFTKDAKGNLKEEKVEMIASPPTLPHGGMTAEEYSMLSEQTEKLDQLSDADLAKYTRMYLPKKPKLNPTISRVLEERMKNLPQAKGEIEKPVVASLEIPVLRPNRSKLLEKEDQKISPSPSDRGGRIRKFFTERPLIGNLRLEDLRRK